MAFGKRRQQETTPPAARNREYEEATFRTFLTDVGRGAQWTAGSKVETRDVDEALALVPRVQGTAIAFAFFDGDYSPNEYKISSTPYEDGRNKSPIYYIDAEVLSLDDIRRLNQRETHTIYRTRPKGTTTYKVAGIGVQKEETEDYPVQMGNHGDLIAAMQRQGMTHAVRDRTGKFNRCDEGTQVVHSKR